MGHNHAGENRKRRLKRRKKHELHLLKKVIKAVVAAQPVTSFQYSSNRTIAAVQEEVRSILRGAGLPIYG